MGDPMTTMFGPKRCALCGREHYPGTACPEPARREISTKIRIAGPRRRMFVVEPSGQFISDEAESAFVVWEKQNGWVWSSVAERRVALNAFSAGWIAAREASPAPPSTDPVPVGGDEHPTPDAAGELAEALAALEPFLRVAEVDIGQDEADDDLFRNMSAAHARAPRITVGHVRRAAQAAARLRSQGSE